MFIVYGFEVASCITAATQRDFVSIVPKMHRAKMTVALTPTLPSKGHASTPHCALAMLICTLLILTQYWEALLVFSELKEKGIKSREMYLGMNGWD